MTLVDILISTVKAGGQAAKSALPSSGIIPKEGRGNYTTAGDLASEKAVVDIIQKQFPTDAILSEETESHYTNEEILQLDRLWVLDPIDGTNNFRNQRYYSCVSLGYVEKGEIKLGAVYDFYHDELFFAEKGKGAVVNNQAIHIGTQADFSQATIATDNSYVPEETARNMKLVLQINPVPFVLMKGSAALMMGEVAAGKTDLYVHTALKPWDNAAGFLILEEAGGVVKGLSGEDITFLSSEVVCGNKTLVEEFIQTTKTPV